MSRATAGWYEWLSRQDSPRVLELGTRRWNPSRPGGHRAEILAACPSASYLGCDLLAGDDVDLVADAHHLTDRVEPASLDALLVPYVLEHLERPWLAAAQFALALRPGGRVLVNTHQTFPLHGYPDDYFRFSDKAMRVLFGDDAWSVLECGYEFPCKVIPVTNRVQVRGWNFEAESWLNVDLYAERV